MPPEPPEPPEPPDNDACCHSGCDPCIFDLYDEERERWRVALAAWEAREAARREEHEKLSKRAPKVSAKAS